jgi:hypothetical protein
MSRSAMRASLLVAASAVVLLFATRAEAQLHWDASAKVGVMKRVLGDRPPSGEMS